MRTINDDVSFRKNICTKLEQIICNKKIAKELESGIYDYATKEANTWKIIIRWDNPHYVQLYSDRLRSVYNNLKNEKLLQEVQNGKLKGQDLAFMTHQEMDPDHWKELIDKKRKRDENKYNNTQQASTDMFTCKKCKSKRCTYYELQTRSADEPATIFVTCLDCGKNWKS
jgi:transcription elongation factor S-II